MQLLIHKITKHLAFPLTGWAYCIYLVTMVVRKLLLPHKASASFP